MITDILAYLTDYSLMLIEKFGYLGIAVISFLENVFTPIPSEAVIPFAGVLVAQGKMNAIAVWVSSMIGGILGSLVFYYLGYVLGLDRVYAFVRRWGKWFFLKTEDVDNSRKWFERFGEWSVFIGRLIPQVRSFISIPAGITRMNLPTFIVLTTLGSGIWIGFLEWIGIYFGENYHVFEPIFNAMDIVFVIVVVLGLAYFLNTRVRKKHKSIQQQELEITQSDPEQFEQTQTE